ncbi:uncharacterized protein LOC123322127 [Coccinella septempunctata]|uniref:uncharacterized protein LOC123322127 n=1 Tax=Coccinella septempunctata TaxID=41139 RepID=UPI001D087A6E|nr:uncharacterized protein LOC123322127 [Coccinella septempunctata]
MDNKPPFISGFIELYRQHPCLWRMRDDNYSNKKMKDEAYSVLLDFYRKTAPTATLDTVKKKINNLRSAFRKELKKVRNSRLESSADGSPYTPSLWYYDLLMFSADQEESRSTVDSDEPIYDHQVETSLSYPTNQEFPLQQHNFKSAWSDSASSDHLSAPSSKYKKTKNGKKRKHSSNAYDDEFDCIGINVACKLRRMDEDQRMYAEVLLGKLLLHGMKGRLQEETDFNGLKITQPQPPIDQK